MPQNIPSWSPISFASLVAFDVVIVTLTIFKLKSTHATESKVGYLIYRDSLMFFLITALTNIMVVTVQGLNVNNLIKATVPPFSTLMTATMSVRVFLNLKLFPTRAVTPLPFSQASSSRSRNLTKPDNNTMVISVQQQSQRAYDEALDVADQKKQYESRGYEGRGYDSRSYEMRDYPRGSKPY